MTTTRTASRLTQKLPEQALSALTAAAVFRGDSKEIEALTTAAMCKPRRERRLIMMERNAQIMMAFAWALDLWKTYSLAQSMSAVIVSQDTPPAMILTTEFLYQAQQAKIASLVEAMRQICSDRGIDFDDAAKMADLESMILNDTARPIPGLVAEFVEQYAA